MKSILLLCIFIASVLGHAVLVDPIPLNPNPTTTQPCGVAALPTSPASSTQWAVGDKVTITWQKVAGDGGNAVSGAFSPTGAGTTAASFTVAAWTTPLATDQGQIKYTQTFTVPNVDCSTATNGLCLFRVYSETNWNSCVYVNVTNCPTCPPPPPAPPACKKATGLTFCTHLNGMDVQVAADDAVTTVDSTTRDLFWQNINNTNVFAHGNATACHKDYLQFVCALNLPYCPGTGTTKSVNYACQSNCQDTMSTCGLTDIHDQLYTCSDYDPCVKVVDTDSASTIALSLFSVVVAALAMF